MNRGVLFLLLIGAAVLVPYLASRSQDAGSEQGGLWNSMWTNEGSPPTATTSPVPPWSPSASPTTANQPYANARTPTGVPGASTQWQTVRVLPAGAGQSPYGQGYASGNPYAVGGPSEPPITGPIVQNGTDLIRFDLTPDWIVSQWPRVSTGLPDGRLYGMRVAMVSGSGVQALAGSLTYYFDAQQVMQRIVFNGSTGDPAPLIADLSRRFGLEQDPLLGTHVLTHRSNGQVTGWLRVKPAAIIRASQPFQRYDVQLELANPRHPLPLSSRFVPKNVSTATTDQ
ncbi:MAG: DUF6690 family protein [Planctomycetota bacterium]